MKYLVLSLLLLSSRQISEDINMDQSKVEIYKIEKSKIYEPNNFVSAIIEVESNWDSTALNKKEDAVGYLQIRPVMVEEVNRILEIKKSSKKYSLEDRWDLEKSVEMFNVYKDFYSKKSSKEKIARRWNGGPSGHNKPSTVKYWNKVNKILRSKYANRNS